MANALLLLAAGSSLSQQHQGAGGGLLDPVGIWRCVLYGNPSLGDERVLVRFDPDRSVRVSRDTPTPAWAPLSSWEVMGETLVFTDPRTGRRFRADLARETLSGEWRALNLLGGWWCSPADHESEPASDVDILSRAGGLDPGSTRRLIPEVMATPTFPVRAIREAREGRVVLCFIVEPSGEVFDPEFVELSDEIFRAPSLDALMRSRYKSWDPRTDGGPRPACRSFIFRLDYVF